MSTVTVFSSRVNTPEIEAVCILAKLKQEFRYDAKIANDEPLVITNEND